MKELETVAPLTGSKKNRTAILSVSERGAKLGQRIKSLVAPHADCFEKENRPSGGEAIYFDSLKNHIEQIFKDYDQVLCIMALGIVVRMIAPYIEHKSKDPAIVVMDEVGHHVISLLSGHLGGANEWTQSISLAIDADLIHASRTLKRGACSSWMSCERFHVMKIHLDQPILWIFQMMIYHSNGQLIL